ncbi:MAG: hypothetical protein JRN52_01885 [Nitrososphaerota archaeon]|nr:hypothetical protein [Nitrososphaerota archaeon]
MRDSRFLDTQPIILSLLFGILLLWLDFSDSAPLNPFMGNLDHVFGNQLWYPTEAFLPVVSLAVFLLFGRVCFGIGRDGTGSERSRISKSLFGSAKSLATVSLYILLLILIDIDDILKVLGIPSHLRVSADSPSYWLPMQFIYPLGSMVLFIAFGKACFEIGKRNTDFPGT